MDLKTLVQDQLKGCVIVSDGGIPLYTPDGRGNYRAQWTRDFYYMIDDAGEFIPPEDIRRCLEYTYTHAREGDGWMPDRVDAHGATWYAAGNFERDNLALANLDDNAFAVLSAELYRRYVPKETGAAFIGQWKPTLLKALHATPVGENGLIWNDPENPHSPYGFTDCICKTGYLCYESLIQWQAYKTAADWGDDASAEAARKIEANFEQVFFPDGRELPLAATCDNRKTDIWAACFMLSIGFPLSEERRDSIRRALIARYDEIVQSGQLRHMPAGEYWDRMIEEVPQGEYQNGAYWATPVRWLIDALLPVNRALAEAAFRAMTEDFEQGGCCECVNGDYRKLPDYVASATAAWGAMKRLKA